MHGVEKKDALGTEDATNPVVALFVRVVMTAGLLLVTVGVTALGVGLVLGMPFGSR